MIEVFITNVQGQEQAKVVLKNLQETLPSLKANFDLNEDSVLNYPCSNSVLRVEGATIDHEHIIKALHQLGYKCEVLEDKVCK